MSVAGAGDVNGDGYDDLIVGAPGFGLFDENGYAYTGAAFVFFGSASGIQSGAPGATVARIASDHTPYTNNHSAFGTSVAGVGDLNGDGFADVVVGAPYQNDGQQNPGAIYVFLGSATGIVATDAGMAAAKLESGSLNSWVGWSEAGAGDVNGDGYDDLDRRRTALRRVLRWQLRHRLGVRVHGQLVGYRRWRREFCSDSPGSRSAVRAGVRLRRGRSRRRQP